MIESVNIKNYKSVVNLSLDLGTFNVLIGENGCGKSNILEAIAFGAAASADKIDNEFLGNRGIRITNPKFTLSAFNKSKTQRSIDLKFAMNRGAFADGGREYFKEYTYNLIADKENPEKWINEKLLNQKKSSEALSKILQESDQEKRNEYINFIFEGSEDEKVFSDIINSIVNNTSKRLAEDSEEEKAKYYVNLFRLINLLSHANKSIIDFIIYSPDQVSLRTFESSNQILPLGIKGEGLFQYLKLISSDKKKSKYIKEIKEILHLIDWYENFSLPTDLMNNEFRLDIRDKYLHRDIKIFDQNSTNEGFLFLLFYATLFISEDTPSFFAIDNIDTALNPKLCSQLIIKLVELSKKHNKQVIVTTHNPAVLDGLNLQDDAQRLFVIRRNDEGHTRAKRIEYKEERTKKLSEIWTKGLIGGLPDNF